MTEIVSSNSAQRVSDGLIQKAVGDFEDGIRSRSLNKLLADIDEQRRNNPDALKDYLKAVNGHLIRGFGDEPLFLADSGKADQLRIEDSNHYHALTVNSDGKPLSYDTTAVTDKHPAAVSDLSTQPYSHISPPGLAELPPGKTVKAGWYDPDFTLGGDKAMQEEKKYTVLSRESQSVTNADGSTTYNYKGKLDSSFVADEVDNDALVKTGNVSFTASETISSDGKVLSRHVDYQPADQKRTWDGLFGIHSYINLEHKRTLNILRAPFDSRDDNGRDVKSIDTKYDPASGRYDTKVSYLDGRVMTTKTDTEGQTLSVRANDCSDARNDSVEYFGQEHNSSGFVTRTYKTGEIDPGARKITNEIKRDENNEIIEFTDVEGHTSKRIEGNPSSWIGPEGPFKAEVFSDDGGNIVEKTAAGSTIVTASGDYVWLDREGRLTRKIEHSFYVDKDTSYTINAQGEKTGGHLVETERSATGSVRRSTTDWQDHPWRADSFELPLLPDYFNYCKEEP